MRFLQWVSFWYRYNVLYLMRRPLQFVKQGDGVVDTELISIAVLHSDPKNRTSGTIKPRAVDPTKTTHEFLIPLEYKCICTDGSVIQTSDYNCTGYCTTMY